MTPPFPKAAVADGAVANDVFLAYPGMEIIIVCIILSSCRRGVHQTATLLVVKQLRSLSLRGSRALLINRRLQQLKLAAFYCCMPALSHTDG